MAGSVTMLPAKLRNHLLATRTMLCVLRVVEQIGDTIESARRIGDIRKTDHFAECLFDATAFTLSVRLYAPNTKEARQTLVTLIENGYHGFVGTFEVDAVTSTSDNEWVIIQLSQAVTEETLNNQEALVREAERLLP